MAVNSLTFNQLASVLNEIHAQATGQKDAAVIDEASFVSVAQKTLLTGYDPVLNAISQVLARTIFATRPYTRKFGGLQADAQRWGAITRKINISDKDFEQDDRIKLTDGSSVDQYIVNKPDVTQLNFYGQNIYQKSITIFRDQLDVAFSSSAEFGQFISMVLQNVSDMIEQAHENTARATLANFIAGKTLADTGSVVHLLTEYNAATGLTLTATTVMQPENFPAFIKWAYSRIAEVSDMMTERTQKYHVNITDHPFMRHTPYAMQQVYLFSPMRHAVDARVLADTFHPNYLSLSYNETVNFWQSINSPDKIISQPVYLQADGTLKEAAEATTISNIFGLIIDEEAAGYTVLNQWSAPTPFNARGGYSNVFWHFTDRYWNDFTENGVILLLD